ncbi:IQ domain-containing protein K [Phascolarctos cinereus]|uniref:IQ domain-containing protein K isoform X2 n=1 Tax=Phascolarctos cinereus TaxID=38626 RepID=A0A6P5IPQ0_PHACI|nr:IQ domain-containing protein K isoform X2 [Phascolarctos cinereus]
MAGKTGRKAPATQLVVEVAQTPEGDAAVSGGTIAEAVSPPSTLSTISPLSPSSSVAGPSAAAAGTGASETPAASKTAPEQEKNLWEQICEEYEAEQPPFPEGYKVKQQPVITVSAPLEATVFPGLSPEHFFQVTPNYAIVQDVPCVAPEAPEVFDPKTCSPREYLENFIFPVLLPGMANLLHQAKKEKCFERKKTKFIACDFLTEWLYNQNPKRIDEPFTEFFSIPFVADWLKIHPRPPIPLSLLLSEEEATLIIQSFWRGYLVRCEPEIQELRQWQKQLREDNHIRQRVKEFWAKQEKKVKCTLEDEEQPPNLQPETSTIIDALNK